MLADVHLGKEAVFQRRGMAIPDGSGESNIAQIQQLLAHYQPQQLLILGDLVHTLPSQHERWIESLQNLIDQLPSVTFRVVSGNHDKPGTASRLPDAIQWCDSLSVSPFEFLHDDPSISNSSENNNNNPDKLQQGFTISGHLHPCYSLRRRKGPSVRMPVFWVGKKHMVLPAFGEFTGMRQIKPGKSDKLFGVGPDGIVSLNMLRY